ncbi:Uncharacterised protein [Mycobacteroides abscessus subsp. abscessus]|nr:Uncharacterised protein [Mycobacteroides abscessus subsp. abscessus]
MIFLSNLNECFSFIEGRYGVGYPILFEHMLNKN